MEVKIFFMKKFLLLFLFSSSMIIGNAQVHNAFPPEAAAFYNRAIHKIKPEFVKYIDNTSLLLKGDYVNTDSLWLEMKKVKSLRMIDEAGGKMIALLILIRCSLNTDAALKQKVLQMQQSGEINRNYESTASLLNKKSSLAGQIKLLLATVNDENMALKDLK